MKGEARILMFEITDAAEVKDVRRRAAVGAGLGRMRT